MRKCSEIDPLVTPYVDGEVTAADGVDVTTHLDACPPCRRHAGSERAVRALVQDRAPTLATPAPARLRASCRTAVSGVATRRARWPLALAATLVLAVTAAAGYGALRPSVAVAAQLTADHLKCFALFDGPAGVSPADVRDALRQRHGWDIAIPDQELAGDLALVGGRHCVYLDGSVAHLLYKRGTLPVSVFVLPPGESLHDSRVDVLGYAAASFERGGRTWVVLAHERPAEVDRLARQLDAAVPRP